MLAAWHDLWCWSSSCDRKLTLARVPPLCDRLAVAPTAVKAKAKVAANAQRGSNSSKGVTVRHKVHFFKPHTKRHERKAKYQKTSVVKLPKMDKFRVIRYPLTTESAMKKIEDTNSLVFIVDVLANKRQIKAAVKSLYQIDAVKINTLIRPDGLKKAYVKLAPEQDALDTANRIGVV
jgi:large subunit ribosomal protein L23Ae